MTVVHVLHQAKSCCGSGSDRRRDDRTPKICDAWIYSPTATRPEDRKQVTGVNLSKHGVAFNSQSPVPIDSFHKIELQLEGRTIISEIRIIHCEPSDFNHFNVGGEFC